MKVFIRHGHKAYPNGATPFPDDKKHDPPLTENGKKSCSKKALELIQSYGIPEIIISSPYRRCRETAEALKNELSFYGVTIDIKIDNRIAEYLGNHKNSKLDIDEETEKYGIVHPENWKQFLHRVNDYAKEIRREGKSRDGGEKKGREEEKKGGESREESVIWIVTHGLVIQSICKYLKPGYKKKKSYDFLESEIYCPLTEKRREIRRIEMRRDRTEMRTDKTEIRRIEKRRTEKKIENSDKSENSENENSDSGKGEGSSE